MALLNPSPTDTAHVALALLVESGGVVSHQVTLGPRQRQTLSIDDILGVSAAVSTIVESDVPVAADRAMTWGRLASARRSTAARRRRRPRGISPRAPPVLYR